MAIECKDAIFGLCEDWPDFVEHVCFDEVFEPKAGQQKEAYEHIQQCQGKACWHFRERIIVDAFRARFVGGRI